jgi:hypothetical protein
MVSIVGDGDGMGKHRSNVPGLAAVINVQMANDHCLDAVRAKTQCLERRHYRTGESAPRAAIEEHVALIAHEQPEVGKPLTKGNSNALMVGIWAHCVSHFP